MPSMSYQDNSYLINVDSNKWNIFYQNTYESSLLLFITNRCNLFCKNCFVKEVSKANDMKIDDIRLIIKSNPQFTKIDLMGGEPLLHPEITDIVKELKHLVKCKKNISIYTNGLCLDKMSRALEPIRLCISFQEIKSNDINRKPIHSIAKYITESHERNNYFKLILLLDKINVNHVYEILSSIEYMFPWLKTLTIGLIRYEPDYWNDNCEDVLSFASYARVIQDIIDNYHGKLNIDIFTKGVLNFENDTYMPDERVNRFKCVFSDLFYSKCLYEACLRTSHFKLSSSYVLPKNNTFCRHTGQKKCLADKVRLKKVTTF